MSKSYSDVDRVNIAKQEYKNWNEGEEITIDNEDGQPRKSLGIVSQVIDNKATGEQTYIVTNAYLVQEKWSRVVDMVFINTNRVLKDL